MMSQRTGRAIDFTDIDGTSKADPSASAISYLDTVSRQNPVRSYKERSFELLNIEEGQKILDVGCGPGDDVRAMAQRVGAGGKVLGVDKSETMIAEARKRSEDLNLPVEFIRCDGHALDFPDDTFDRCRADRVLMHVEEPEKVIAEMFRVTKPSGAVVVVEPDWETLVVDTNHRALARKIFNFHCDNVRNGWIGRRLPRLFKAVGLKNIRIDSNTFMLTDPELADTILAVKSAAFRAYEAGVLDEREVVQWLKELKEAGNSDRFFCAITGFAAVGYKAD